jgi:glycosyltransferase involved in cell wall biosynthesis
MDVRTTFMQHLPLVHTHHQAFLPVFPFAFESMDLREYDVVLSMSSAWAKNVLTRPDACHICYCLTPMRFGWSFEDYVQGERVAGWQRALLNPVLTGLRLWDTLGANRVDYFVAISSVVERRIRKYYRRESAIIHPPVPAHADNGAALPEDAGDYFLVASRLIPYKRIDLAIQACNRLGARLVVLNDGRDRARLEAMAGPTVRFLGRVDDATKWHYLRGCKAFLFPAEEDFGITPVEAMAAGRPVVAFGAGGALDTVVDGVTGVFFRQPTAQSLANALEQVDATSWDADAIVRHASRFDVQTFKERLSAFVTAKVAEHRATVGARPK